MSTYTRPAKTVSGDGGTTYVAGNKLPASELNADIAGLVTKFNGDIDQNNISASAQILNSSLVTIADTKVDDSSSNEAAMLVTVTPGDSGTVSLATDLKGELERLRYRIGANNANSLNLKFKDTAGSMTAASYFEPPIVGRNLLPNPGFEGHSAGTPNAPDGWTLVLTPTAVAIESAADPEAGADKRSLRILADAASVGIQRIVTGLKPSTKYLVGLAYTLTTGEINLLTVNGLGSGDYQDLAFNDDSTTSSGIEVFQGIVKTDATPTDITVQIVSSADLDDFNLYYAWFYEMSDDTPLEAPHLPMQTKTYTSADDAQNNTGAGAWVTKTDLSLTQYVPFEGYRLTYEVSLTFTTDVSGSGDNTTNFAFRLQQKIGGDAATTVEGPLAYSVVDAGSSNTKAGSIIHLKYVIENPVSGSSYLFTVDAWNEGTGTGFDDIVFNPTVATGVTTQSSSRLYSERI